MANQLFAKKSLKVLLEEMAGAHRLRRVLGPVTLTSLGIGAVIGLVIYFAYGRRHSILGRQLAHEISVHGVSPAGMPMEEDQPK